MLRCREWRVQGVREKFTQEIQKTDKQTNVGAGGCFVRCREVQEVQAHLSYK